jgi:hypothetical protein
VVSDTTLTGHGGMFGRVILFVVSMSGIPLRTRERAGRVGASKRLALRGHRLPAREILVGASVGADTPKGYRLKALKTTSDLRRLTRL